MFYLFRMIVFFVLNTLYFVIVGIVLQDQAKKSVLTKKRYNLIKIIGIACVLVVTGISFIPFEAPFVRFDTPQEALKYRWIDTEDVIVRETDDCAFLLMPTGTDNIYSVTKDENGYGYINYHTKNITYVHPDGPDDTPGSTCREIYACYNQDSEKTLYLAVFYKKDDIDIDSYTLTFDGEMLERIPGRERHNYYDYCFIDDNAPKETFETAVNGESPKMYRKRKMVEVYHN